MNIPGLGELKRETRYGQTVYVSAATPLPLLKGHKTILALECADNDAAPADFAAAAANLLAAKFDLLESAAPHILRYYRDVDEDCEFPGQEEIEINSAADVWRYVSLACPEVSLRRRDGGDGAVYAVLELECAWEEEHGLQVVLRSGNALKRVSPCDGELSNADANGDEDEEDLVYSS